MLANIKSIMLMHYVIESVLSNDGMSIRVFDDLLQGVEGDEALTMADFLIKIRH